MTASTFSESVDGLIRGPQYAISQAEKEAVLLPLLRDLCRMMAGACPEYGRFLSRSGSPPDEWRALSDVVPLPVSVFKKFALRAIPPEAVVRELRSSSTTGQSPSRIFVDKATAFRQARALAALLKEHIGEARRPYLVLDAPESVGSGGRMTARGAAIRGVGAFATDTVFAMVQRAGGLLDPDFDCVRDFFAAHGGEPILLFGFTFLIWTRFVLEAERRGISFAAPGAVLLHSGGWKKLRAESVTKEAFTSRTARVLGCDPRAVLDFYGMVEQVGTVFVDCPSGNKHAPAYADLLIRAPFTLAPVLPGEEGIIEVLSVLPTSYPGQALLTEDRGIVVGIDDCPCGRRGRYFRFTGRVEQAELRGCGDILAHAGGEMSVRVFLPGGTVGETSSLSPVIERLNAQRAALTRIPAEALLTLIDDFGIRLLSDPRTRALEGVAFLSGWLRRSNMETVLRRSLGRPIECLDHFVAEGAGKIAAKPRGLVAMWLAGNVPSLPIFSLVPALLAKNVMLLKLAAPDPSGMDALLSVFAESKGAGLAGGEILNGAAVVWYDYRDRSLGEQMSLAADARVVWGGAEAVRAVSALAHREHCTDLVFGPKYSIGIIDRLLPEDERRYRDAVAGFVRDCVAFDQRACSAPQTIFIERAPARSLREVGESFADQFRRLPPKQGLDAYTTLRILDARATWGMHAGRDLIVSGKETDWTICMDREISLKEAVQSRTLFLTEIETWRQVIPLLSPRIQTVGIAFGDAAGAEAFAEEATACGVVRCVRPGLMNAFESPWDGRFMINELVRWVTLKP